MEDSFKVPNLPTVTAKPVEREETVVEAPLATLKSPAEVLKERSEPLPTVDYIEPEWAGKPPENSKYYLEELKGGTIVSKHLLGNKGHYIIGRFKTCDILLQHPSLSRFHAVIQYKAQDSPEQPVGFYLYDLGSQHGTKHNNKKCFPKTYYRLRVGHTLKFGGSTRLLILQGPNEEMEDESAESVTELREMAAEKARIKDELQKATHRVKEKETIEETNDGISWGFAEDAVEEDVLPDMSKNPFSLDGQSGAGDKSEDLQLDDPKKTLRGWFEREGYELEYDCKEDGYAAFTCKVSLPINEILGSNGPSHIAEASVKGGKKKDAVINCALEACKILNSFGILRQSSHESRAKRQAKKWKEEDYYDSDEDEFLDRTGSIAAKRQKRMQMDPETENGLVKKEVDTYETLQEKYKSMHELIKQTETDIKESIAALNETKKLQNEDIDDLDSFMDNLSKTEKGTGGKEKISKLKQLLLTQQKELGRIEKLMNIARPTQMPKLSNTVAAAAMKSGTKGILIGKRYGLGSKHLRTIDQPIVKAKLTEDAGIASNVEKTPIVADDIISDNVAKKEETKNEEDNKEKVPEKVTKKKKKKCQKQSSLKPTLQDELAVNEDEAKIPGDYDASDEKYATWVPPSNQDGSGRTSLNEKLGY